MGRLLVGLAFVALAGAPSALADDAPAGFVSHPELAARVEFVAGRPISVWCAANEGAWTAERAFLGADGNVEGFVLAGKNGAHLSVSTCAPLVAKVLGGPIDLASFAESLLALTHEAEHLAGQVDEHATDCAALAVLRRAAANFGFRRAALRERIYRAALRAHARRPAPYRGPCGASFAAATVRTR
jgi:hypothetical protein